MRVQAVSRAHDTPLAPLGRGEAVHRLQGRLERLCGHPDRRVGYDKRKFDVDHYHRTWKDTDRTARNIENMVICRTSAWSVLVWAIDAQRMLPTATSNTARGSIAWK